MSTEEFRVPMPVLRAAVRTAAEATSYRHVARELGLTPTSTIDFATGETQPQDKTLIRLRDWYLRRAAQGESSPAAVDAAFSVLLEGLPAALAGRGAAQIAKIVKTLHAEYGAAEPPPWIPRILARPIPAGPPGREHRR